MISFKQGKCKNPSLNKFTKNELDFNKLFNLTTKTSIYSNYQNTLSFIISISFNSIILHDDHSMNELFEGFELKFKSYNNETSCIQIIPSKSRSFKNIKSYSFKIKDPSFLSLKNKDFSFFFGKVSIAVLEKCDNNDLCSSDILKTNENHIGIQSEDPLLDSSQPIQTSIS